MSRIADIAHEGIAALNETYRAGDTLAWRRHVEAALDEDVTLEPGGLGFTEGEWRGHDGAVGFVANQMDALDEMWIRVQEIIEIDDDCAVVGVAFGGRARHTGIPIELQPFHVFGLRDGRVLTWRVFPSRPEALEAAGGET
jgi:ketosteroid isomerase-like protein